MRRIARHQRREAVAPVGDVIECPGVRCLVGVINLQVRADGAGVRKRHTDRKILARRGIVERVELQRVVFLDDDHAGILAI